MSPIEWKDFLERRQQYVGGELILQYEGQSLRGPVEHIIKNEDGTLEISLGWLALKQSNGKFQACQATTTFTVAFTGPDNQPEIPLEDIGEGRLKFSASGYEYLLLPASNPNRLRARDLQRPR